MNTFYILYARAHQFLFKILIPFLPYREPTPLKSNADIVSLIREKKIKKIIIVTGPKIHKLGLVDALKVKLSDANIPFFVYDQVASNPTIENIEDLRNSYQKNQCDGIIAFGGGSPMDAAKILGARIVRPNTPIYKMKGLLHIKKKLPLFIAIPTTAGSGSETTIAAVITDNQAKVKYAINDFCLIPHYVLLDYHTTTNLPPSITSTTGMDALTHAIEAYIGNSTTKKSRNNALEACKLIFENLPIAYKEPNNKQARYNMLLASYKAGMAFTVSYVGYVHALAHALGGKYNIAHGLANSILLPVVLKSYGRKAYKKLANIALFCKIASENDSIEIAAKKLVKQIEKMQIEFSIPTSILELKKEDIPYLAIQAEKEANPLYPVPKIMNAKELSNIYKHVIVKAKKK